MTDALTGAAPAIRLAGAAFGYNGISRIERLTLDVPEGAAVAVIGPNGSGKSTLLRGVLGLAERTAGEVEVLGTTPERARGRVGALPQADTRDTSLPLTLRQVVSMGLYRSLGALKPMGRGGRAAVNVVLEKVGLTERAGERFGELSGGQQQRGILARALVADPALLLLDEPFNGLDRENREKLLELVRGMRDERRTVLVSTHDLEIAQRACTHVLLISAGHTPGQPGHPASFGPIGDALTLDAVQHAFQDSSVEIDEHTVTTASCEPSTDTSHHEPGTARGR